MNLTWRRRALRQLDLIYDYISQFDPAAADTVSLAIEEAAIRLKSFPRLGRPSHKTDVRLLQVPGRPYLLPYRLTNNSVEILAVVDERMERPPEWL